MVYLAFDLDGTLGDFMILWKIICGLRQESFFSRQPYLIAQKPHNEFEWELSIAYFEFIKSIAQAELSDKPLGIFRPGIFRLMKKVIEMKRSGFCKGVILYTNNGSLSLVEFIRDVFTVALGSNVFDDVLHYYHPIRIFDALGKPSPRKTWVELHKLLTHSACKAPKSVKPEQVLFFDDQYHQDLMDKLKTNYHKVPEYIYNPPTAKVVGLYHQALKKSDILDKYEKEYLTYVAVCSQNVVHPTIHEHLKFLETPPIAAISVIGKGPVVNDGIAKGMLNSLERLQTANSSDSNATSANFVKRKSATKRQRGRKAFTVRHPKKTRLPNAKKY
jgi:hypothetical protein